MVFMVCLASSYLHLIQEVDGDEVTEEENKEESKIKEVKEDEEGEKKKR